jgi:hypothetical protein
MSAFLHLHNSDGQLASIGKDLPERNGSIHILLQKGRSSQSRRMPRHGRRDRLERRNGRQHAEDRRPAETTVKSGPTGPTMPGSPWPERWALEFYWDAAMQDHAKGRALSITVASAGIGR